MGILLIICSTWIAGVLVIMGRVEPSKHNEVDTQLAAQQRVREESYKDSSSDIEF